MLKHTAFIASSYQIQKCSWLQCLIFVEKNFREWKFNSNKVGWDWRVCILCTLNTWLSLAQISMNLTLVHVNYPVSTCSVDTHNTNMFYSSVTLTNHCSTLMDIQSMATMYVSCEHSTSIIVNSLMLQQTTAFCVAIYVDTDYEIQISLKCIL